MNTADMQNLTRRFWHGDKAKAGPLDIVDTDAIVAMTGFTKTTVNTYAGRDDFPSPVARMGRRVFWRKEDIEHWNAARVARAGT